VTLADLRKVAIRRQFRIHFPLPNGLECVVNEHGVAQVPKLRSTADFNLERDLESARHFILEPLAANGKTAPKSRSVSREELEQLTTASPTAAHPHDEHDDE